ncbi:MAG: InlB B-repeat-containing protein, partial [Paludibacteraceae bacterium]|nr:InlB B-repeat-containing protein [Paludibacteraceae bacterium]
VNWDEKVLKTQTVDWNTAATAPEDPEREGYTFTGWDPADFSHITSDLTVTAQYKENPGTGVDEIVNRKSSNRKLIIDGVLYIERNGRRYDAAGRIVD